MSLAPLPLALREKLLERASRGEPVREVARALGCSLSTAYRWLRLERNGYAEDARSHWVRDWTSLRTEAERRMREGEALQAIASDLRVGVSTLYRWRNTR